MYNHPNSRLSPLFERLWIARRSVAWATSIAIGILAFFLWSAPFLGDWENVLAHFGRYWQNQADHKPIIGLFAQVLIPPLLAGSMTAMVCIILGLVGNWFMEQRQNAVSFKTSRLQTALFTMPSPPSSPVGSSSQGIFKNQDGEKTNLPGNDNAHISQARTKQHSDLKRLIEGRGRTPVERRRQKRQQRLQQGYKHLERVRPPIQHPQPIAPLNSPSTLSNQANAHGKETTQRKKIIQVHHDKEGLTDHSHTTTATSGEVINQEPVTLIPGGPVYVLIKLLGELSVELIAPNGTRWTVPMEQNKVRQELLAYFASYQGQPVDRDKMLEEVFAHGYDMENKLLAQNFNSNTRFLREDIRTAAKAWNEALGYEIIPLPDKSLQVLDYHSKTGVWRLSAECRVVDLPIIDQQYQIIKAADKAEQLNTSQVQEACDLLLKTYPGDFLARQVSIGNFADNWSQSWVRDPYTHYRDCLLDALRVRAEIEQLAGDRLASEKSGELNKDELAQQKQHFRKAVGYYRQYALTAASSRFDKKARFDKQGRNHGIRLIESERMLRRCLDLLGVLGDTSEVDEVRTEYITAMVSQYPGWQLSAETIQLVDAARERTSAHRRLAQITSLEQVS